MAHPFKKRTAISAAVLCTLAASIVRADVRYVSPTGNDGAAGTLGSPWKTVNKAVTWANAGDTVIFRGGQYNERLLTIRSGGAGNPITFRNHTGEEPILDGNGQSFNHEAGMVEMRNKSHIVIEGFEIRNLTSASSDKTPIGVLIYGDYDTSGAAPENVTIRNCKIQGIRNNHANQGNAHGILVRGEISTTTSNIVLEGNEVYDNTLGWSEAVAINGNVDGFAVIGNTVRDNNNIGIDAIGYEDAYPANNSLNSNDALNRARNGLIAGNLVYNCTTTSNPNYGNSPSAGGIYVDGGTDIIIERNQVYGCDIGVEIASEASGKYSSNCTVRNNILHNNRMSGILTGGYSSSVGGTANCVARNNTLFENNTLNDWAAEVLVRRHTYGLVLENNIICANNQAVMVERNSTQTSGLVFDYNCYFATGGASNGNWQWSSYLSGFTSWKSNSGQDANSVWGNPLFVDISGSGSALDFNLTVNSAAIDSGDPAFTPAPGETDFSGNARLEGTRVDTGALEYAAPLTGIAAWRMEQFGSSENTGIAANDQNPDKDNANNGLEYAFGTGNDPNVSGVIGLPAVFSEASGSVQITFTRNTEATDTTYNVRATSSLANEWPSPPIAQRLPGGNWTSVSGVIVSDSSGLVVVTDSRNIDGQCYYRVDAIFSK